MSKRVTMIWVLTCLLAVTGCAQESLPFVAVPGGTFTRGVEGGTGFPNYDTVRFIVDPGNRAPGNGSVDTNPGKVMQP